MPNSFVSRLALALLLFASSALEGAERPVTFTRDVAPIIFEHCTPCHRPDAAAPFSLQTYDEVRQRARQIVETTADRVMPPWKPDHDFGHFEGERRLEAEAIDTLRRWVDEGTVEGDPRDRPPLPKFSDGWQLGKPDLVLTLRDAYTVPAEGGDLFRNFVLPVPLNERRYVQAIEFRPGNGKVIHHARILLDETGDLRQRDLDEPGPGFDGMDAPGARFPDGHFLGWAPGKMARREEVAWPLNPRTDLIVQLHLKPTGRLESVKPSIGIHFTNKAPEVHPVLLWLGSRTIDIPAGESDYVVTDSYTLPVAVRALSIYPHAHYLGREMTIVARLPDGATQRMLRIGDWDFNWQDEYEYAEPMELPKGATLMMQFTYDNSPANPHNPTNPPQRVLSGPGSSDEMGEVLIQLLAATEADAYVLRGEIGLRRILADVAGEEKRVADVPTDHQVRNALGVHYVQLGRNADARAQFEAALALVPDHAVAHYNLALVAIREHRADDAFQHLTRAVAAKPEYAEAHTNLGALLDATGRPDEAIDHYRKALESRPDHSAAHANLARAYMRRGRPEQAIRHYEQLQRQQPENAALLGNLAAAYAGSGQLNRAVQTAHAALQRAITANDEPLARELAGRVQEYEEASQSNRGGVDLGTLP
jgi:tetratricopeptide (TPR) repeat protein